jgi:DNA-binding response OmpR family regulator
MKVLIIEDSPEVVDCISMSFEFRWPEATILSSDSGHRGVKMVETESPDIVILDINLPDIDGFEVLRQVRFFSDVPVIILTVRDAEIDKLRGFEAGADDYIVKPFSALDFLDRVSAVLRPSKIPQSREKTPPFVKGDLFIDFDSEKIFFQNQPVHLAPKEYQILRHLVQNEGKFVSADDLARKVWGTSENIDLSTIKRHILQLRTKLQDSPTQIILSGRGKEYKFVLKNEDCSSR